MAKIKEKILQQLLMRSDPFNIKDDLQSKKDQGYIKCSYKNCDSCNNFADETTYTECNTAEETLHITRKTLFM